MPDYNEIDVFKAIIKKSLANVHSSIVGRVEKVNAITLDVQPVIRKVLNGSSFTLPLFKDVPPIFIQGGDSFDAMPITEGDYCLLFVNEQCIDRWYNGEDDLEPLEDRQFDYSDCFALCGVNPASKAIPIPNVATSNGDRIIVGDHTHTGETTQTGDIILNGVSIWDFIQNHTHGGVQTGGGNTAPPNPL